MHAALAALLALLAATCVRGGYDWNGVLNNKKLQTGDATFYGQQIDQDSAGTCSFGANFANTMHLPWTNGVRHSVALNDNMFNDSLPCGTCILYRGLGQGLGTTPVPTTNWTMAIVNNRCPECSFGDIDLNLAGDGRWKVEWHAVPCNVGASKLKYSIVVSTYYWFSLVVSNTRIPVAQVQVKINDVWVNMKRANNNQWPYYNTNGPWQTNFPMPIRVTSIAGETVEDVITSVSGGDGQVQFSPDRIVRPEAQAAAAAGGWSYAANVSDSGYGGNASARFGGASSATYFRNDGSQSQSGSGQGGSGGGGSSGQGSTGSSQGGSSGGQGGSPGSSQGGGGGSQGQGGGGGQGGDSKPVAAASVGGGGAPAPAPVQLNMGTPAPTQASARGSPATEAYAAVGGRRLLRA